MADRLRLDRIVLPAASTLERLALIVRAQAREAADAGLIQDCSADQEAALERMIAFDDNRIGELRDRTFENQRQRASGLTPLTAAVTLWNTVYLDRAVWHFRASGSEVPDEPLAHVAPLGGVHIGLTGNYRWSEMDKPRERFRP